MLSRRGFFSCILKTVAAVVLPVAVIGFDPVKQKVCKPTLVGYKGKEFWSAGVVYAPYIPLYQTCHLTTERVETEHYGICKINS